MMVPFIVPLLSEENLILNKTNSFLVKRESAVIEYYDPFEGLPLFCL